MPEFEPVEELWAQAVITRRPGDVETGRVKRLFD